MFRGSLVALVTPMLATGEIDWDALDMLVELHVESGTAGIVPTGTTGESATLDVDEHLQVIKRVVAKIAGRLPVVAGTGANATKEGIELSKMAAQAGVDACLLVAPYYNKPPQEGLYRHYLAIAEAVDIPQLLYNVPGRTACDLLPETVCRLAQHPNIVGIKEASGEVDRVKTILAGVDKDFVVLSGEDARNLQLMQAGAVGCISVTANAAPQLMADFCNAYLADDQARAHACHEKLLPLHDALFIESSPIPVKWALHHMGLIKSGIRLPLVPLVRAKQMPVQSALQSAGLL